MLENFQHVTQYRIPFSDLDYMQHVNHLAFARWTETTRSDYFVDVLGETVNGERGLILVNMNFTYEMQLGFREHVAIGTRISRIGTRSFEFSYDIVSTDKKARVAYGTTAMVAYDYHAHRSIAVPQDWRDKITAYEKIAPIEKSG
jgi:acyl-CoA thioester hydrolase